MTPDHSTPTLITLLTDFGNTDYYVAAVKGTLLRLAPGVTVVDLSHEVPPGAIDTGAFLLAAAAPTFPPGTLHLAVVDPGVGSERRILAVETPGARYVGPDNGLLTPALVQPGARAYAVDRPDLYLSGPGKTFHGRDRFAPVAAALANGEPATALGAEIHDAVRLEAPPPERRDGVLTGRVVHIDRFGNLVTDIPSAWVDGSLAGAEVRGPASGGVARRRVTHYGAIPPGEPAVLPGSLGTEELSLPGQSLAKHWGITIGAQVRMYLR